MTDPFDLIRALPVWSGPITVEPLPGGLTNRNYLARDAHCAHVVRIGRDNPEHMILRANELAASRAAHRAGVSPPVIHAEPGVLVLDYIEGAALTPEGVRANLGPVLDLVARAHREIPRHFRGPAMMFWVFQVIRDYAARLAEEASPHAPILPDLRGAAQWLERAVGPVEIVFGHNDLLAANVIDDGTRLWLIDWDYAGFNSPLFDLGGLAGLNALAPDQEKALLEAYFQRPADEGLLHRYGAMKAAALLRETLWSMVSETHSRLDFDYAAYTATNLAAFQAAFAEIRNRTPAAPSRT